MGSVPLSTNGAWEFHNRRTQDEDEGGCEVNCPREEMKSGVVREGKDGVGEKDLRNNKSNQNVNNGHVGEDVQAQVCVQIPLKLPHVSVVCWERFLPRTTLRVLLVENDDSTRHLVFALLRNCGYEVTTATNGLHAWKILMDKTNHIDLVLTEVDMPYLSGIGLLSKIMNTECCKNIPVIMMSCTDPEVLVLKCLSKGAVSFLVKPVRKNELKILWQHVWRRCHSFSDSNSGSESGVNTKKLAKVNNAKESGNNADSNNGNENECTDLNEQDECGHDNSAQSSWRKSGADVDIPLSTLPCNELVHANSTCAQVMHPRTKAHGNDQMPTIAMECCKDDERLQGDSSIETDFEIQEIKHRHLSGKDLCNLKGRKHDKLSALEPKRDEEQLKKELVELLNEDPVNKLKQLAGDLKGTISNDLDTQAENLARSGITRVSQSRDKVVSDANDPTSVELNIKRPRDIGGTDGTFCDSRNVMKCSNLPNFLRYSIVNHASQGEVESHTHIGSNSETLRKQSKKKFSYNLNNTPDQQTNECSNENDMGSIATNAPTRSAGINKNGSINNGMHVSSPFQSVLNCPTSLSQQVIPKEGVEVAVNIFVEKPRGAKQKIQVQHHHHHHHYYHQRVHETQEEQSQDMTKVAVQSGSSNAFNRPAEVTVEKYSSSGSGSGSKRGSNVLNGSNCDVSPGETDLKSENMVPGKGEDHVSLACENRRMIDKINCSTEAGMNKFIQKRKKDA